MGRLSSFESITVRTSFLWTSLSPFTTHYLSSCCSNQHYLPLSAAPTHHILKADSKYLGYSSRNHSPPLPHYDNIMQKNAHDRVASWLSHPVPKPHTQTLAPKNMTYSKLSKSFFADITFINNFITISCQKRWERAWEGDTSCSSPLWLHGNEDGSSLGQHITSSIKTH